MNKRLLTATVVMALAILGIASACGAPSYERCQMRRAIRASLGRV